MPRGRCHPRARRRAKGPGSRERLDRRGVRPSDDVVSLGVAINVLLTRQLSDLEHQVVSDTPERHRVVCVIGAEHLQVEGRTELNAHPLEGAHHVGADRLNFSGAGDTYGDHRHTALQSESRYSCVAAVETSVRRACALRIHAEHAALGKNVSRSSKRPLRCRAPLPTHRDLAGRTEEPRCLPRVEILSLRHERDSAREDKR